MKKDCLLLGIRIPGQYYRSKAKSISNSLSFRSVEIKPPERIRFRTRKRAIGSQRLCAVRPLNAQLRILHVEGCQQRLNGRQSVRAQQFLDDKPFIISLYNGTAVGDVHQRTAAQFAEVCLKCQQRR